MPTTLDEYLEARRKNPARPQTPLSGSATLGGPGQVTSPEAREVEAAAQPPASLPEGAAKVALGTAGAVAGTAVGGPPGGVLGAAAGSAVAGELMAPEDETTAEAMKRRVMDTAVGGAGELGGQLLHKTLIGPAARALKTRISGTAAENIVPGALGAQALLASRGTSLPLSHARGGMWSSVEAMLRGSFTGNRVLIRSQQKGIAAATAAIDDVVEQTTSRMTTDELGQAVLNAYSVGVPVRNPVTARAAYSAIDDRLAQSGIGVAVDLRKIQGLPTKTELATFQEAFDLQEAARAAGLTQMADSIDTAIKVGGLRLGIVGEDAVSAYATARAASQVPTGYIENKLVAKLAESPGALVNTLIKADNPALMKSARETVFGPAYRARGGNPEEVWSNLQGRYLADLKLHAGGGGPYPQLNGKALGSALDKHDSALMELFPDATQRATLRTAARAIELINKKPSGNASMLLQFTQTSSEVNALRYLVGFGTFFGTESTIGAAAFLLTPGAVARALTNPKVVSFLLRRAESSVTRSGRATSSAAGQAAGQFGSILTQAGIPFELRHGDDTYTFDGKTTTQQGGAKPTSKLTPQ